MTRRALLVSAASPYPVVTNGCARLVGDYLTQMFPGYEVDFLLARQSDWAPIELFRRGASLGGDWNIEGLVAGRFAFVLFVGFKVNALTCELARLVPSFCFTDTLPHPDVPEDLFRGIISHRSSVQHPDLVLIGGSYDDEVFYPARKTEELVLSVGRIDPSKGQLELVSRYRREIFEEHGLPLHLVGGVGDLDYFREVDRYIDGVSVVSSIDSAQPLAETNWRSAVQIAELCNRARLFVTASPKESFGMALIEALACGTTCVVNGDYWGFTQADLQPNVYGNITAKQGSVLELAARALRDEVRIDASAWARKYSLKATRQTLSKFIDDRL